MNPTVKMNTMPDTSQYSGLSLEEAVEKCIKKFKYESSTTLLKEQIKSKLTEILWSYYYSGELAISPNGLNILVESRYLGEDRYGREVRDHSVLNILIGRKYELEI